MATKGEKGFFEEWPDWSKPAMALAAMVLLGGAWIGVPSVMAWHLMQESIEKGVASYEPIVTVLVAMTTATIASIFLFMTFRIDRGTRLKAESVAKKAVKSEIKKARELLQEVEDEADGFLKRINENAGFHMSKVESEVAHIRGEVRETVGSFLRERFDEGTVPENIRKEIELRLTEDVVRKHVEAVLLVDANIQVIGEYARQRASDLDQATVERIVELMDEMVKAWTERETPRRGVSGAIRAFFGKFRRS